MADVFISHSSKDREAAVNLCSQLEARGITCWMAPRDIKPGEDWAKAINNAITASDVFLIIYSVNSSVSTQVPKEIGLAGARGKYIVPYKIDNTNLTGEFEYHLLNSHWIVADIAKNDYRINELVNTISTVTNNPGALKKDASNVNINTNIGQINVPVNNKTKSDSGFKKFGIPLIIIGIVILAVLVAILIGVMKNNDDDDDRDSDREKGNNSFFSNMIDDEDDDEKQNESDETDKTYSEEEETALTDNGEEKSPFGNDDEEADQNAEKKDIIQIPVDYMPYEYNGKIYNDDNEYFFSMDGIKYNTGIVLNRYRYNYILLNNTEGYTKMKFTLGHLDGNGNEAKKVRIYYDGEEAEVLPVPAHSLAEEYEFDITGVRGIKIAIDHDLWDSFVGIVDFYMYNDTASGEAISASASVGTNEEAREYSLVPVDYKPYEYNGKLYIEEKETSFSMGGVRYNTGIRLNRDTYDYVLINNIDGYTKMKFTLGHIDGSNAEEKKVRIYYDNEEAEVLTVPAYQLEKEYEFDITGVNGIKIAIDHDLWDSYVGITNFYMYNDTAPEAVVGTAEKDVARVPVDIEPYEVSAALRMYSEDKEYFINMAGEKNNTALLLNRDSRDYLLINNTHYGYKKMKFTVGHTDGSNSEDKKIRIYYDGEEAEVITIPAFSLPKEYEFDITGVKGIRIAIDYDMWNSYIGIVDFYLYNDTAPETVIRTAELDVANVPSDIMPYERAAGMMLYDEDKERSFSFAGESRNTGMVMNRDSRDYFLLNNTHYGYTKMKFTAGHIDGYTNEAKKIRIYYDNQEAAVITIEANSLPKEYEFDITGVKGIRIAIDYDLWDSYVGITDCFLYN